MKALRTSIIGCGHFARRHAERLAALEKVQLVGFCDTVVESAVAFNHEFGQDEGQVYTDYERMFDELGLDLPTAKITQQLLSDLVDSGHGEEDHGGLVQAVEQLNDCIID